MNYIREIVSGKRKRTKDAGYNLDLSYVCPRLIAMSFPAEGFEVTFRNNIKDVVNYIQERHNNDYHIYNLSGRSYQKNKFAGQVSDFPWEDHHSPPIHVLFNCCKSIDDFLAQKISNVVAIHCLAGKGRTGTALCCYLIYSGRFNTAQDALEYYMKRRFYVGGGVTMPSQIRYVHYFEELVRNWRRTPVVKYITSITLTGIPIFSKHSCRPFIEIFSVNQEKIEKIYTDKKPHNDQKKYTDLGSRELNIIKIQILKPFVVNGDILLRVFHNGKFKDIFMFRLAFNTAFIPEDNILTFELNELDPNKIVKDERYPDYFYCEVKFQDYCQCTNRTMFNQKCKECSKFMNDQKKNWEQIHNIMKEYQQHSLEESKIFLFGDSEFDDVNEVLYQDKFQAPKQVVGGIYGNQSEEQEEDEEYESSEYDADLENQQEGQLQQITENQNEYTNEVVDQQFIKDQETQTINQKFYTDEMDLSQENYPISQQQQQQQQMNQQMQGLQITSNTQQQRYNQISNQGKGGQHKVINQGSYYEQNPFFKQNL